MLRFYVLDTSHRAICNHELTRNMYHPQLGYVLTVHLQNQIAHSDLIFNRRVIFDSADVR